MKNFIQTGCIIDFTAPSGGVVSGTPLLIGTVLVVPQVTAAEGESFAGAVYGVYELPKATSTTPAQGGIAYWDNTAKKITTTASGNTAVGFFTAAALSADTTCFVKLDR
jgi:predicted RecA/RadA family phage recombinase